MKGFQNRISTNCLFCYFFLIGMFFIPLSSLQAQGVTGGLSLAGVTSQIDGDSWGGFNKWGFHFGGYAQYRFSEKVGLQTEILYGLRGSREVQTDYGQITLQYIDVPVLFQYIRPFGSGQLALEVGISVNILMKARTGFKNLSFDQTENYRRYSLEWNTGGSYKFSDYATFFGRWSVGLSNLNNTPTRRPWLTIHYLSFGFRLHLK
jgi:hypothetical protein